VEFTQRVPAPPAAFRFPRICYIFGANTARAGGRVDML
jgi:hypothetical protein